VEEEAAKATTQDTPPSSSAAAAVENGNQETNNDKMDMMKEGDEVTTEAEVNNVLNSSQDGQPKEGGKSKIPGPTSESKHEGNEKKGEEPDMTSMDVDDYEENSIPVADKSKEEGNEKPLAMDDADDKNENIEKKGEQLHMPSIGKQDAAKDDFATDKPNEGGNENNKTNDEQPGEPSMKKRKKEHAVSKPSTKSTRGATIASQQQNQGRARVSQQGNFVKLSLTLPPPPQKLGLVLQDDEHHYGLPILVAISPDSPLLTVMPPHFVQNYWLVGMKDKVFGEAKMLNSNTFQEELKLRRNENEETLVEFSFARRGTGAMASAAVGRESGLGAGPVARLSPQQNMGPNTNTQQKKFVPATIYPGGASQLLPGAMLPNHADVAKQYQQEQMMVQHMAHQNYLQQLTMVQRQQQTMMQRQQQTLQTMLPKKKEPKKQSKPTTSSTKGQQKGADNTKVVATSRDETIRRTLSEFFTEGESRPLKQFCHAHSRLYTAISKEVNGNMHLRELCDVQDTTEGNEGFSKDNCVWAMKCINQIYSCDYSKKRKMQLDSSAAQKTKKGSFPPLEYKGTCKGLQSKMVENYCKNPNNDKEYLYEKAKLSNFNGWRHKDCQFITEIDNQERCFRCRNTNKNFNRKRHPILFQATKPQSMEEVLLPKTREIRACIQNRIVAIEEDAIPNDPQLVLASKLLRLMGKSKLELDQKHLDGGTKDQFIICDDCGIHMLKKRMKNNSTSCAKCQETRANGERAQKSRELNREKRVAPDSKTTFSVLTSEEAVQRYNNLKSLNKSVTKRLQLFEKKDANKKAKVKDEQPAPKSETSARQNHQFRSPLLPWPFYLNYNPIAMQEYSMPIAHASASVARGTAKSAAGAKVKSVPKSHVAHGKSNSPGKNTTKVSASLVDESNIPGSNGNPPMRGDVEDTVTGDIAGDPLDYASVGSSQEEAASLASRDEKGDGAANQDGMAEFDGHLV